MEWNKSFDLNGQVAVVTGAAAGIGYEIAALFAQQGAQVILIDMDSNVIEIAHKLGSQHIGMVVDIANIDKFVELAKNIETQFGSVDILVNNAGIALLEDALVLSEASFDKTMEINFKAPFFLSQAFAPLMMKKSYGRIINMASQASVIALSKHAAYCASKAAIVSMTKVFAAEWASSGITVNAISPTVVETELGRKAWAGDLGVVMKQKIPVGSFAQPSQIAQAALFLSGRHSGMITGENLIIDGGYTII